MATLEKIWGCGKNIIRNSLWSVAGLGIALFGYGKLYGAQPIHPTHRDLDVKTEQLESGLEATVVSGMFSLWFDDVSIVVDNENNPHIIYKSDDRKLELADINDGQWRAINIGPRSSGGWNSIVMDNEGYFHISSTNRCGSNEDLLYFTDRDGWEYHKAHSGLSVGLENDIAIDSKGNVHISHWQWNGGRLLYSTNKNGDWETTILDEDAGWRQTSIAIDDNDNIHISYSGDKLGVLDNLTGEWINEELPSDVYDIHEMIMDKNNILHIVGENFNDSPSTVLLRTNSRNLIYSTSEEGYQTHTISEKKWRLIKRQQIDDVSRKWFDDASIVLDLEGNVHVAVIVADYPYDRSLVYLTNKSGEWKEFLIDRGLQCYNPAIALDNEDSVHIAYSEGIKPARFSETPYAPYADSQVKYVQFNPSELFLPYELIRGLCYRPYREGQDPTLSIHPSIDDLTEDLSLISKLTPYIRTYGIDGTLFEIPELCFSKGIRCFVGIPLSKESLAKNQALEDALNLEREKYYSVDTIVAGNEAISKGDLTAPEVAGFINTLREKIEDKYDPYYDLMLIRYITTADAWGVWLNNPELADAADIIMANIHSYWDGVSIENAAAYVVDRYNELDAAYNKQVVISETGWPSDGEIVGNAVPSLENQRRFLLEFMELAKQNKIPYFYFETFDQPWRTNYEGEVGRHFGLVDADGHLKPSLEAILPLKPNSLNASE